MANLNLNRKSAEQEKKLKMAVEYCPSSSTSPETPLSRNMSPRISFSHDLSKYDVVPVEPHLPLSPSSLSASASFNFNNNNNNNRDYVFPSSADELFSNGVLLPSFNPEPPPPIQPPNAPQQQTKARKPPPPPPQHTTSFWKFRRSRSCNCGSIYTGTLCPILLLPRSKSTGSTSSSNSKKSFVSNAAKQRNLNSGYQKPPLNKGFGSNAAAGFRVAPVLNVSSGNLFGLGSLFTSKFNRKKLGS